MKNLSFRTTSYSILIIILSIICYLIRPIALLPIFFAFAAFAIGLLLFNFLKIFDTIENNSAIKYWEIKQDDDNSNKRIKKFSNFLYSYCSLLYSNFLIASISIFLLYKFNNDVAFLLLTSTTIVILIRILAYKNREIAREIGKGLGYAMLPLGFALFIWDFFGPLINNDPFHPFQAIYTFIITKVPMTLALILALVLITSFEPLFDVLVNKINRYFK